MTSDGRLTNEFRCLDRCLQMRVLTTLSLCCCVVSRYVFRVINCLKTSHYPLLDFLSILPDRTWRSVFWPVSQIDFRSFSVCFSGLLLLWFSTALEGHSPAGKPQLCRGSNILSLWDYLLYSWCYCELLLSIALRCVELLEPDASGSSSSSSVVLLGFRLKFFCFSNLFASPNKELSWWVRYLQSSSVQSFVSESLWRLYDLKVLVECNVRNSGVSGHTAPNYSWIRLKLLHHLLHGFLLCSL